MGKEVEGLHRVEKRGFQLVPREPLDLELAKRLGFREVAPVGAIPVEVFRGFPMFVLAGRKQNGSGNVRLVVGGLPFGDKSGSLSELFEKMNGPRVPLGAWTRGYIERFPENRSVAELHNRLAAKAINDFVRNYGGALTLAVSMKLAGIKDEFRKELGRRLSRRFSKVRREVDNNVRERFEGVAPLVDGGGGETGKWQTVLTSVGLAAGAVGAMAALSPNTVANAEGARQANVGRERETWQVPEERAKDLIGKDSSIGIVPSRVVGYKPNGSSVDSIKTPIMPITGTTEINDNPEKLAKIGEKTWNQLLALGFKEEEIGALLLLLPPLVGGMVTTVTGDKKYMLLGLVVSGVGILSACGVEQPTTPVAGTTAPRTTETVPTEAATAEPTPSPTATLIPELPATPGVPELSGNTYPTNETGFQLNVGGDETSLWKQIREAGGNPEAVRDYYLQKFVGEGLINGNNYDELLADFESRFDLQTIIAGKSWAVVPVSKATGEVYVAYDKENNIPYLSLMPLNLKDKTVTMEALKWPGELGNELPKGWKPNLIADESGYAIVGLFDGKGELRYWFDASNDGWVEVKQIPASVRSIEEQLESSWGLAAEQVEYAPASEVETAHLAELAGVQAEDLGAVFKVKTVEGSLFWATEREGVFAVRQVPAYERYENGQPVAVPAHEEAVAVKRMLDDPTEFGHWNGGKVVEVQTAEGTGWYYPGEKGEWEKIYESGFDYELLYRQSVAVLERLGKLTPNEANDPKIVHDRLQQFVWERTKATGDYAYVGGSIPEEKLLNPFYEVTGHWGLDLGARWIHFQAGGKEANGLVLFDLRGKNRRNDVESVVYPLLLGFVADGQWQPTIFEERYGWPIVGLGGVSWRTQRGRIQFDDPDKIRQLFDDNLGREMIAQGVVVVGKDFVAIRSGEDSEVLSSGQRWIMDHLPQSYLSLFSRDEQARLELSKGDILKRLMEGEMEVKANDVGLLVNAIGVDPHDFQVPNEMRGGLEK